jgi:predicted transcriptional regulator
MKRRGSLEISVRILEAVNKYPGLSRSRVLVYCGLVGNPQQPIVQLLIEQGLLEVQKTLKYRKRTCFVSKKFTVSFVVTPKGTEWMLKAQDILAAIT